MTRFKLTLGYLLFFYLITPFTVVNLISMDGSTALQFVKLCLAVLFVSIITNSSFLIQKNQFIYLMAIILITLLVSLFASFSFRSISLILYTILAFILCNASNRNDSVRNVIATFVVITIYVYSISLFLQIALFYLYDYVDIHSIFFPFSEQRIQLFSDSGARLGGINNEPGTLAQMLFILLFIHMFIADRINIIAVYFGITAMAVSLSSWGMLAAAILYGCLILRGSIGSLASKFVLGVLAVAFSVYYVTTIGGYEFFLNRIQFETGSGISKIEIYNLLISDWHNFIFVGYGLNTNLCDSCEHVKDAGLLPYFILTFGYVFTFLLWVILTYHVFRKIGLIGIPLLAVLSLTKFGHDSFISIFVLTLILIGKNVHAWNNPSFRDAKTAKLV